MNKKTLVIYAHPQTKGNNTLVLEEVEKKLNARKIEYEVLDLYKMKYDPVLHEREHYTSSKDNRKITKQNQQIQEKITNSDRLIFIYPLWWDSMPAILKGFFDKTLTPGFGYYFKPTGLPLIPAIPVPLLKGKKAVTIVTHGNLGLYYTLVLGNRGSKIVTKDTLGFMGIKAKFFRITNASLPIDTKRKRCIKKKVRKAMKYLYR